MKRFLFSIVIAFAVSANALAGDIPSGGAPAPAPNGDPISLLGVDTMDSIKQLPAEILSALLVIIT